MPRHEGGGQSVSDFSLTPETLNDSMSTLFTSSVFRCLEVSPTHVLAEQKIDQNGLRPGGFVPGPVQFSLADLVLW